MLGMVYHNMVNTTIPASGGDSGAPLYTKPTSASSVLYGNFKGNIGSYTLFLTNFRD